MPCCLHLTFPFHTERRTLRHRQPMASYRLVMQLKPSNSNRCPGKNCSLQVCVLSGVDTCRVFFTRVYISFPLLPVIAVCKIIFGSFKWKSVSLLTFLTPPPDLPVCYCVGLFSSSGLCTLTSCCQAADEHLSPANWVAVVRLHVSTGLNTLLCCCNAARDHWAVVVTAGC